MNGRIVDMRTRHVELISDFEIVYPDGKVCRVEDYMYQYRGRRFDLYDVWFLTGGGWVAQLAHSELEGYCPKHLAERTKRALHDRITSIREDLIEKGALEVE